MSDPYADDETPESRAEAKTLPPTSMAQANPPGSVLYVAAYDADGLAGWLWVTSSPDARPRAGLVLVSAHRRDPSVQLQNDLGDLALNLPDDADAYAVLEQVTTTRDGYSGKLTTDGDVSVGTVEGLRVLAAG